MSFLQAVKTRHFAGGRIKSRCSIIHSSGRKQYDRITCWQAVCDSGFNQQQILS